MARMAVTVRGLVHSSPVTRECLEMKTEKAKMLSGELYNAADPTLVLERRRARDLLKELNDSRDEERERRAEILGQLLGGMGRNVWIEPPFPATSDRTSSLAITCISTSTA